MLFNSTEFLFFLPAVFAVYWLLQSKLRWQNLFVKRRESGSASICTAVAPKTTVRIPYDKAQMA